MNAIVRTAHRPVFWNVANEFDNIFDNFLKPAKTRTAQEAAIVPAVDITESDTTYTLYADMPGVVREDLSVTIDEGVLTFGTKVPGVQDSPDTQSDGEGVEVAKQIRRERRTGAFSRTLRLADDVDESGVHAVLKDGVLTLTLPKQPKIEPRKIDVTVS